MLVKDIFGFNYELFFDGAVNVKWLFEDTNRFEKAANSFLYHNNKYLQNEKYFSTIDFLSEILDSMYEERLEKNNMLMAIAPYGAGKSHFITSIFSLISNNSYLINNSRIFKNISQIDSQVSEKYRNKLRKPNLVLVFNGMEYFDLSAEMEKQIKYILDKSNIKSDIFEHTEVVYEGMRSFIDTVQNNSDFIKLLEQNQDSFNKNIDYLKNNLDKDKNIFNFINLASKEILKREFKITDFLNPKSIIEMVCTELCGKDKPFDKMLILFDEIGRYIEWISENKINNYSIQQLFEGLQTHSQKVTFISFSQKSLDAYYRNLSSSSTDMITRYIDRFKSSRKFYISNILEIILSRLIIKKISDYEIKSNYEYEQLIKWIPDYKDRYVWSVKALFEDNIARPLEMFHPLTIYSLIKLAEFTQNRSAISVLKSLIEMFETYDIKVFNKILPCSLFETDIIENISANDSFLNHAKGSLDPYISITTRPDMSNNLTSNDRKILQAITLINILSLTAKDKDDYYSLINNITMTEFNDIIQSISKMHDDLGIIDISDDETKIYIDLQGASKEDLKKYIRLRIEKDFSHLINDTTFITSLISDLGSSNFIPFSSSLLKKIETKEWYFSQSLVHCNNFDEKYLITQKKDMLSSKETKQARGKVIWVYYNSDAKQDIYKFIETVQELIYKHKIKNIPLYIFILNDEDKSLLNEGLTLQALKNFNQEENSKYSKFIDPFKDKALDKFIEGLTSLQYNSYYIDSDDYLIPTNYKKFVDSKMLELFTNILPIRYVSMDNKSITNAVKDYFKIAVHFSINSNKYQDITNTMDKNLKQRFDILFLNYGLELFDEDNILKQHFNNPLEIILNTLNDIFNNNNHADSNLYKAFSTLYNPPYGVNLNTFMFLLCIFFKINNDKFIVEYEHNKHKPKDWLPKACHYYKKVESVLRNSVVLLNQSPKDHELLYQISSEKDYDTFCSYLTPENHVKFEENSSDYIKEIKIKIAIKDELISLTEDFNKIQKDIEILSTALSIGKLIDTGTFLNESIKKYNNLISKSEDVFDITKSIPFNSLEKLKLELTGTFNLLLEKWIQFVDDRDITIIRNDLINCQKIISFLEKTNKLNLLELARNKRDKYNSINEIFSQYESRFDNLYTDLLKKNHKELNLLKNNLISLRNDLRNDLETLQIDKSYLSKGIERKLSEIEDKMIADNKCISDLITKLKKQEIQNLQQVKNIESQLNEFINLFEDNNPVSYNLIQLRSTLNDLISKINLLKSETLTIPEIANKFTCIEEEFLSYINISNLLTSLKNDKINQVRNINNIYLTSLNNLYNDSNFDKYQINLILDLINKKPITLEQEDLIYIEQIKRNLVRENDNFIEKEVFELFQRISCSKKRQELISKLTEVSFS